MPIEPIVILSYLSLLISNVYQSNYTHTHTQIVVNVVARCRRPNSWYRQQRQQLKQSTIIRYENLRMSSKTYILDTNKQTNMYTSNNINVVVCFVALIPIAIAIPIAVACV